MAKYTKCLRHIVNNTVSLNALFAEIVYSKGVSLVDEYYETSWKIKVWYSALGWRSDFSDISVQSIPITIWLACSFAYYPYIITKSNILSSGGCVYYLSVTLQMHLVLAYNFVCNDICMHRNISCCFNSRYWNINHLFRSSFFALQMKIEGELVLR